MPYNEEETKLYLITPKLKEWVDRRWVNMEYYFTDGKVIIEGDTYKRGERKKADYLLNHNGTPIAIIEAKDESHHSGAGMQQAKGYAQILDIRFAYSSNGHGIEEFDFFTNTQTSVDRFPTPDELWSRYKKKEITSLKQALPDLADKSQVAMQKSFETYENLLNQSYYITPNKTPRYYQEIAINRSLEAFVNGRKKMLLNLATGTGKTFIAFQIAWKLKQAGLVKRVLFLADRNILAEQAYNAFEAFGNARDYINEGEVSTAREIYFSIYQALYALKDGKRIYAHYPKDFFDLIIIDEAHRSGFGTWMDILNHFDTAVQLGMTATPKETENVNTYKYFSGEQKDVNPLYEYSMAQGIEDGFLANFILYKYRMNTDTKNLVIEQVIDEGANVEVPEGANLAQEYSALQYERDITLPDRTKAMCDKLAMLIKQTGEMQKTIIFCVSMDHAADVMKQMQNHFAYLGFSDYAVRIVSEETSAITLLRTFQDETTERPVIATTVDLLSTGFDAPSLRNVVFMKYVSSPIVFKQILGRGTRISEDTNKYAFRIIDFTNATRLMDSWVKPPSGSAGGNLSGVNLVCGIVTDKDTRKPIIGARILLQVSANQQKTTLSNEEGFFVIHGLPEGIFTVSASANKYRGRQSQCYSNVDCVIPISFDLSRQGASSGPIKVTGLNVIFEDETIFEVDITGERLTLKQYVDYTKEKVKEKFETAEDLREDWADRNTRKKVLEDLEREGINTTILAKALKEPEADDYDLLANIAFEKEIQTRQERAEAFKNLNQSFVNSFSEEQKDILQQLLYYYQLNGAEEFVNPKVFELIFPTGGAVKASEKFGNTQKLISALSELQKRVYKQ
ncbi:MAG: EcoAI/FtnUII family type I restriction enzme subunit R [Chitinophagaceae bacterium]